MKPLVELKSEWSAFEEKHRTAHWKLSVVLSCKRSAIRCYCSTTANTIGCEKVVLHSLLRRSLVPKAATPGSPASRSPSAKAL